jgi:broad specificity phosphatase PhoE
MKTKLIFVRHGDLVGERKNVLHSPHDPVSLSEPGIKQMENIAELLREYSPSEVASSLEKRTIGSAQIIGGKLDISPMCTNGLQGRNWGDWAGKTWEEVSKTLATLTLDERYLFIPPNGESWQQFESRILEAITFIANQHSSKTIVIVSHGSTIRVLLPKVFDISVEESLKLYPDYGTLSISDFEDGQFSPIIFNGGSNILHSFDIAQDK